MTLSAHDVARELRESLPDVGVVKVHKLLYYCQGWSLVFRDKPMFEETIAAWANGPVVASMWADERHRHGMPPRRVLDRDDRAIIDYVISRYGRMTGQQLIRQTHAETPWIEASERDRDWSTDEISLDAIRKFFAADEQLTELTALARQAYRTGALRAPDPDASVGKHDDPAEIRRRISALVS